MLLLVSNDFSATSMMEKRNVSDEKQSQIFNQMTFELRSRREIMKENSYTYEERMRIGKQLVASHCLKEDIEGRRKGLINFLLEMRFSIR